MKDYTSLKRREHDLVKAGALMFENINALNVNGTFYLIIQGQSKCDGK